MVQTLDFGLEAWTKLNNSKISRLIKKVGRVVSHLSELIFVHIRTLGREGRPNLDIHMSKISYMIRVVVNLGKGGQDFFPAVAVIVWFV